MADDMDQDAVERLAASILPAIRDARWVQAFGREAVIPTDAALAEAAARAVLAAARAGEAEPRATLLRLADEVQHAEWPGCGGEARVVTEAVADMLRDEAAQRGREAEPNPLLAEALRYYAERRTMNNPKGWAHVVRVLSDAYRKGAIVATEQRFAEASRVLGALVEDEEAARREAAAGRESLPSVYYDIRERNNQWAHASGPVSRSTYLVDTEVLLRLVDRLVAQGSSSVRAAGAEQARDAVDREALEAVLDSWEAWANAQENSTVPAVRANVTATRHHIADVRTALATRGDIMTQKGEPRG